MQKILGICMLLSLSGCYYYAYPNSYYPYGNSYPAYNYNYPTAAPQQPYAAPSADNGYCREYNGTAIIEGRQQPMQGTACRQSDGSWKAMD